MTPIQERTGCLWQSADPADVWLNESGQESPKIINCQTPQGGTALVRVEDLNFIGAGLFGAGRPCLGGSAKWTGDSYRYGIYTTHKPYTGPAIVILQSSGCGMVGLQFDFRTSVETWQHLTTTSSPEMLWNVCHELFELHREALEGQRRTVFAAFVEGRLKKSKRKGHYEVTMVPLAA
jgi:hypothetical protein